ncbi:2-aminoethylphosphonate--pyruvate transaminase [Paenibacillus baekrokdamisoli]|uniref:2-aminoethylphosphonate--pyruvate transaminase n=1 Tax=Paenibacillus baekrokdamisoli TaxID=1712516 RepID=A0A3G9JEB0_9BACL|nr:2-aminoethylphosphonate--pyruvate transaminase [Paenibacillus baekrokdamisoli]MBB3071116.1 2-aminoethylphosphonate-pyruvate transaminase [Paenibacillus baekrokdamisoli]BBH21534.1 2-aminoethylphosphonate--pyruvate transaminase [Paenibacillus baekrokdamisoli]
MTLPQNPYLLLTPGPLSTSKRVKAAMQQDWCTWDKEYNDFVQEIRARLVRLATAHHEAYTSVLLQGSGTYCVEAVIGSVIPKTGKLAVLANGAYGQRIAQIARILAIEVIVLDAGETEPVRAEQLEALLAEEPSITHVAFVHGETTTGMLNPIADIAKTVNKHGKVLIVDAMSTFGGIEMDIHELGIDFLISSCNKCLQGVPGFGFILARTEQLEICKGYARSLSLDLVDQWETMEKSNGKWRFTSPTHVVHAFYEALLELEEEGGIKQRQLRYEENQRVLVEGMKRLGFQTLLPTALHSPIITSFYYPDSLQFSFEQFYDRMKQQGFVLYPGKITAASTFRIGNIGDVHLADIHRLIKAIESERFWL